MPDPPILKKRKPELAPISIGASRGPKYAELRCKTNFSFLRGASHPDELVNQARSLNYSALAITDLNTLSGVVRSHVAAKEVSLKIIVGAEVFPTDMPPIVLWASDRSSYANLCKLLTLGQRRTKKGECQLAWSDIADHHSGLLVGLAPPQPTPSSPQLHQARELFADRAYLLADAHLMGDDRERLLGYERLANDLSLPMVASGNVLYHKQERQQLHDVLTAIRLGKTVAEIDGEALLTNGERHLRNRLEIERVFSDHPCAIATTNEIAERCTFSLDELRYEYPDELTSDGQSPLERLTLLTWKGARDRFPASVPAKVRAQLEHELTLIRKMRYEAYFLTVWDLVRFARSKDILCQGRGSAANSAVCYCLEITSVDPSKSDLLFERFVSEERGEPPDIDVDFEHERREEVLQYVYSKYGRDRAALAATVITYRTKSAIRDVGKALGISPDRLAALSKQVDGFHTEPNLDQRLSDAGINAQSVLGKQLISIVSQIINFPRHLSQHVGGMVMTRGPLCEVVPIENAAMPGRTIVQWEKDDLEAIGILKVDCLALGMLTAIRKCLQLVEKHTGEHWTLATIPSDDCEVYNMICRADTLGVFQIESRAQMSMLPRLKPRCFYDLVIEVAIVRPGPIQGDMVHPYLKRRAGKEEVTYPNDAIKGVLDRTLGVPIFQEQAMKLAEVAAGFSPGEADQLRRAMAAWKSPGMIEQYRVKLLAGMRKNGLDEHFAERCYKQLKGFGEYGFPESHAASFALLVYASCWVKHHHPAAFCAAMLNSQPLGFYAPAQLVRDAIDHGVTILPVDVNYSDNDCTLEQQSSGFAIRIGMRMVSGLSGDFAESIVRERLNGAFSSLADFQTRTACSRREMTCLSAANAFESLQSNRRQSLWHAISLETSKAEQPLFDDLIDEEECISSLPPMSEQADVFADYNSLGLSLGGHPIGFSREQLASCGVLCIEQLQNARNESPVKIAGLVLMRQRPGTAKGITFVTIEDETGAANLIIRPSVWERYARVARSGMAWVVSGKLQTAEGVIHVLVSEIARLDLESCHTEELAVQARNFR